MEKAQRMGVAIFPAKWLVIRPSRMTTQREAIFKPLGLELTRQMEAVMGRTPEKRDRSIFRRALRKPRK